jgi:hypothetical protein
MNFASVIRKRLDPAAAIGMGTPYKSWHGALKARPTWFRAEGQLALRTHRECGETSAPVKILVHSEWMQVAPVVFCGADFIRQETDWHIQDDGSLCHVLAEQWRWQLGQWWEQGTDIGQVVDRAAIWCCQNVDSLITRHLHGHRIGLTKWPKQWEQWSHYQQGIDEFKGALTMTS